MSAAQLEQRINAFINRKSEQFPELKLRTKQSTDVDVAALLR